MKTLLWLAIGLIGVSTMALAQRPILFGNTNFAPYLYEDEKKQMTGIIHDTLVEVFHQLKVPIQFATRPIPRQRTEFLDGRLD